MPTDTETKAQAIIYAESKMVSGWKRNDLDQVATFYNHMIDFLIKGDRMRVSITLRRIEGKSSFPCFCIPIQFEHPSSGRKYLWQHAGIVDSLVRTAADYFEIVDTKPAEK
jgi:hypothetical protein